jgi:hypothetical protein
MKIKIASVCMLAATILASCGGSDKKKTEATNSELEVVEKTDKGPATPLEGAWEIKRAISPGGELDSMNLGTVYEFKGNKLSFGKGGFVNPGTTVVTDTTFSFQADGNELKFGYHYKLIGDTLVVEMDRSGGQTFFMVKK